MHLPTPDSKKLLKICQNQLARINRHHKSISNITQWTRMIIHTATFEALKKNLFDLLH